MTIQNMRYIIEIARCQSISAAAKSLFMTQSAISNAVKETEDELGIQIFVRTSRGVSLTYDGEDFLKYCKEMVGRMDLIQARYQKTRRTSSYFSVSCQHLPFAIRAFRTLIADVDENSYDFSMWELPVSDIFHDVSNGRSEIGVFTFRDEQVPEIRKTLYLHDLEYTELGILPVYVFLRKDHPLSARQSLGEDDLLPYPYLTYVYRQDEDQSQEEILVIPEISKYIHVYDRSTKLSILKKSDAFSIGVELSSSPISKESNSVSHSIMAIPLVLQGKQEMVHVGYVSSKRRALSLKGSRYLELLCEELKLMLP